MTQLSARALAGRGNASGLPVVRSAYQPIVHLHNGDVIGYEALVRGPEGTELESPAALFIRARELGTESAFDLECQTAALAGALAGGLPSSMPLFVNAEPRWLHNPWPAHLASTLAQALERVQLVVEITERALTSDPAGLLAAVGRIREVGWGVALDDVGVNPASLALMPMIDPDVIKLDLRLIQQHTTAEIATIVNAVIAQAERSGAIILAEGIETPTHRRRALAMGATLGQGWLFGRPGPLPAGPARPARGLWSGADDGAEEDGGDGGDGRQEFAFTRAHHASPSTPFEMIRALRPTRVATKGMLLPMSKQLERHALGTNEPPVLLSAFEDVTHFTADTARRYAELARHCSFVGALGAGMRADLVPGVRGADLALDDRLRCEWVVCVVGPHFSAALIAQDLGDDDRPDRERRFEVAITYDRELVLAAARSLFSRISAANR